MNHPRMQKLADIGLLRARFVELGGELDYPDAEILRLSDDGLDAYHKKLVKLVALLERLSDEQGNVK